MKLESGRQSVKVLSRVLPEAEKNEEYYSSHTYRILFYLVLCVIEIVHTIYNALLFYVKCRSLILQDTICDVYVTTSDRVCPQIQW